MKVPLFILNSHDILTTGKYLILVSRVFNKKKKFSVCPFTNKKCFTLPVVFGKYVVKSDAEGSFQELSHFIHIHPTIIY